MSKNCVVLGGLGNEWNVGKNRAVSYRIVFCAAIDLALDLIVRSLVLGVCVWVCVRAC